MIIIVIYVPGASVEFNQQVSSCDQIDGRWKITTADGKTSMADSLILTMPVPQMLGLKGTVKSLIGIYVVFCNLLFILDNSTRVQTKISLWGRFVQQHRIYRIFKENKSIKFEERL